MSIVTDAGMPAVSSEEFAAAVFGTPAPAAEPVAQPTDAAPSETPATPPAQTETEPTATAPEADKTAPAAGSGDLEKLQARLAELENDAKRREGQYSQNVTQQREALQAEKARADAAEKRATEIEASRQAAAEKDWNERVAAAQQQIRGEQDPNSKRLMEYQLSVAVQQHDAEQRQAEADRRIAEASAKEARLQPVYQELQGLQAQAQVKQFVDGGLEVLKDQGASNLATETGVPVDEVRAYLTRPQIQERLSRALALTHIAQITGQPVPTTFQDLGEQIRDHFVEVAKLRGEIEERQVKANQEALVAASRPDGGGGGTAPARVIATMADVTTDDFARAMGLRK